MPHYTVPHCTLNLNRSDTCGLTVTVIVVTVVTAVTFTVVTAVTYTAVM